MQAFSRLSSDIIPEVRRSGKTERIDSQKHRGLGCVSHPLHVWILEYMPICKSLPLKPTHPGRFMAVQSQSDVDVVGAGDQLLFRHGEWRHRRCDWTWGRNDGNGWTVGFATSVEDRQVSSGS